MTCIIIVEIDPGSVDYCGLLMGLSTFLMVLSIRVSIVFGAGVSFLASLLSPLLSPELLQLLMVNDAKMKIPNKQVNTDLNFLICI